jgi:ubiquinone/menaquinone biosynthesis C-methylase UbiE
VADIGAGTAKLSCPLAERGLTVRAVEPNDAMRERGISRTAGLNVTWSIGTGEATGLADASVKAAFFGSSFNVVEQASALRECARILRPSGWFCCLWNHRVLDDPTQAAIETTIKSEIPNYDYGNRRQDPSFVIAASGFFMTALPISRRFVAKLPRADVVEAWLSHATLIRQAGNRLDAILSQIETILPHTDTVTIPYETRAWIARREA